MKTFMSNCGQYYFPGFHNFHLHLDGQIVNVDHQLIGCVLVMIYWAHSVSVGDGLGMSSRWERGGVMFYNGKPDLTQYWMTCLERVTYAKDRFCRYMYTNHFSRYKRQNYSISPPILHTFPVYSFCPIIFVSSLYIVELVLGLNMHSILAARRGRHLYDLIILLI